VVWRDGTLRLQDTGRYSKVKDEPPSE